VAFYRARLRKFCDAYNARELASLTPLEVDEHLADAGAGMFDSTRHRNVVALERLQKFALEHWLIEMPAFEGWKSHVSVIEIACRLRRKPKRF